jgi:hypothetical protein
MVQFIEGLNGLKPADAMAAFSQHIDAEIEHAKEEYKRSKRSEEGS